MSRWRDRARPIITRVLLQYAGRPEPEIQQALREAYPFGIRAHHPYKIWLSEIKEQRRARPKLQHRGPEAGPNQLNLFS